VKAGTARRGLSLALLVAVSAAGACDSPTVPERSGGYDFSLPGPDLVFHWGPGAQVRVFVSEEPAGRAAALADAFDAATAAWATAAPFGEFTIRRATSVAAADVVLAWADGPFPVQTAECLPSGGGLGLTTFCLTADNEDFVRFPVSGGGQSDVFFLVTISASIVDDQTLLRRLVTHELGHALGLFRHSPNPGDLMFGGELVPDLPTEADRATIFALYHSPRDLRP
jgi:hypothetical protein